MGWARHVVATVAAGALLAVAGSNDTSVRSRAAQERALLLLLLLLLLLVLHVRTLAIITSTNDGAHAQWLCAWWSCSLLQQLSPRHGRRVA